MALVDLAECFVLQAFWYHNVRVASLYQWWGVFSLPVVSHLSFDGVFLRSFIGIIRDDLSTCGTFGLYGMHPCSLHWLGTVRIWLPRVTQ